MTTSITEAVFLYVKLGLTVKLHVYRKEVNENCTILDLYNWKELLLEFGFI
jgi:hypothetical protein